MSLDLSIVTPSYNMLGYLQRCCLSIADQADVELEHIVIDGASTDGSPAWLRAQSRLQVISEADEGMYDAINKGLALAQGPIVAYLNCDEQYLPGTASFVREYFDAHPDVDMIFGHALVIRPDGGLIAYRKAYQPRWFYVVSSHLYMLTCTMFFRRRILDDGFRFDTNFKAAGDLDFVVRLLRHGYRIRCVRRYLSLFTMTGSNLGATDLTARETHDVLAAAPAWIRALKVPLNMARLIEKFVSGAYWQTMPLSYSLYVSDDSHRSLMSGQAASFRWPRA